MILVVLILTGCASQTLNSKLPLLVGKDIDYAIGILGKPTVTTEFGHLQIVEWNFNHTGDIIQSGLVAISGNKDKCSIKLRVRKNIIQDWDWDGNEKGCKFYSTSVEKIAE